jgi:hypothetical protein
MLKKNYNNAFSDLYSKINALNLRKEKLNYSLDRTDLRGFFYFKFKINFELITLMAIILMICTLSYGNKPGDISLSQKVKCTSVDDALSIIDKALLNPKDALQEVALTELKSFLPKLNLEGDKPPALNVIKVDVEIDSYTALMLATLGDNIPIVEFLLSKGADVTIKSRNGNTAIDLARKLNREDVNKVLILHK